MPYDGAGIIYFILVYIYILVEIFAMRTNAVVVLLFVAEILKYC